MGKSKWITKTPRYYEGVYYDASPEFPALIEIDDKYKPHEDKHGGLTKYTGGEVEGEKLRHHFASVQVDDTPKSGQVFSELAENKDQKTAPSKGKRPSDQDV